MRILSKPLHFLQVSISFEHSPPSYLPHDEARIRTEVEELRQYKETDLRAERQFLEHRKEHIQFEPLCQHCRDEVLLAPSLWPPTFYMLVYLSE